MRERRWHPGVTHRFALLMLVGAILAVHGVHARPAVAQVQVGIRAVPGGPYSGTVGVPVSFNGSVRTSFGFGSTQFQWSFGDGTSGFGANTSHVYLQSGTYVVSLTVTDPSGLSDTATTTATIQGAAVPLQVSAGGPYTGVPGGVITFTGSVSGAPVPGLAQATWSFGDGGTGSGLTTARAYRAPGTYIVSLTVTTVTGQTGSAQTTAVINQALSVSAGTSSFGTVGSPMTFGATVSGASRPQFTWTFGDGTSGSGAITTHTYASPGTFTVTVTVVDQATSQQASDSITATVNSALSVDANGPYNGIAGRPLAVFGTISGSSNSRATWDFGDGGTATGLNATHTYATPGNYTLRLSVVDGLTRQTVSDTASANIEPGGPVVSYAAGWNLVAGPSGTPFSQSGSPLYTFQAGDRSYQTIQPNAGVQAGYGYWAYFPQAATVTLSGASTNQATINVPGGQFVMVGNPSATVAVTIRGADTAISFDPVSGKYKDVSALAPGAGAWVYVANGGTVTLSP